MKKTTKERCESVIRLREIMDLTQAEFAKSLGISLDLIKGVESGRNPLSVQLRETIYETTGAQVMAGAGKLPAYFGKPYEREHFKEWRNEMAPSNRARAVIEFDEIVAPAMTLMLLAATRPAVGGKVRDRLPALLSSWSAWVRDAVESFGLQPQIQDLLSHFPETATKTLPWRMWRHPEARFRNWKKYSRSTKDSIRKMHLAMQAAYGFSDDKRKPDSDLLELTVTLRPMFDGPRSFAPEVRAQIEGLRSQSSQAGPAPACGR